MHVSRNKCELIAECCIEGVRPKFINLKPYVKDIDISEILVAYEYYQKRYPFIFTINNVYGYNMTSQDVRRIGFERITQTFYTLLNSGWGDVVTIQDMTDRVVKELDQINKYRELEEDLAYV